MAEVSPAGVDLITVLWWAFLVVAWLLIQRGVGFKRFNTFTLFLPLLLLTNGLFVPWSRELNTQVTGYDLSTRAFTSYWLSTGLMFASMPIGIALANQFRATRQASAPTLVETTRRPAYAQLYVAFVVLLSTVSLIQIHALGIQLDLKSYFTGFEDYAAYEAHRYPFAAATTGIGFYLYHKLAYGIAPLAYILIWQWPGWSRLAKVAILIPIALAAIQSGHKEPLVFIVGTLVIASYVIRHGLRLTRRSYAVLGALAAVLVLVILPLFYMTQGLSDYPSALYWGVYRVIGEPLRTLQLYFEVYPTHHPFLHGLSSRTLAGLAGAPNFQTAGQYIPNTFLGIENTTFPALFIGDAWADFGYAGVVLYSVFIAFLLQAYNIWYFRRPVRYLEDTALLLTIAIATEHLFASTIFSALLTFGLGSSLLVYLAVRGVRLRGSGGLANAGVSAPGSPTHVER